MKIDSFQAELEKMIENLGYVIRKEKGSFRGDFCVLEGDKLVMVNKNYPPEFHVGQMVRFLEKQDLDDMFIKPAVRKEFENWINKINT
jgi:hypothetical protein